MNLEQLEKEKDELDCQVRALQKELSMKEREIQQAKISAEPAEVVITDHAVLRYMERVLEVDVGAVRENMLDTHTKKLVNFIGSGKVPFGNHRLIVRDKAVVSVV